MRNICIIGDFSDKDFVEDVFSALGWDNSGTIGKDTALIIGGGVDASRLPVSEAFCIVAAGPLSEPIGDHVQQCFDTGEIIRTILASYERKMRLVAVRGAGDLATGTIIRLLKAGYSVIAAEIEQPTVIRRTVSFAEAVYEGKVTIEGVDGILTSTLDEALSILGRGAVPVLVDPSLSAVLSLSPEVLVDAAIAKRNLGTRIDMAPLVVALGPGFTAGVDADAVIETKRGHTLGSVIYNGSAIPNTGIPGNIAGYAAERVMHSPCSGAFRCERKIGDIVHKGEAIAYVGDTEIPASIDGKIRGLLHDGLFVPEGFKIADIDPRGGSVDHLTVSDKARAIAGGVLEAVDGYFASKSR